MTFSLNIKTAEDLAAEDQARLAAAVNAERDRRIMLGTTVTVTGLGAIPVQGRPVDQVNLMALADTARDLIAAGVTGAVIPFRDGDNVLHDLTPAQMLEVSRQGKEAAGAIYAASWALKDGAEIPAKYADDDHWPSWSGSALSNRTFN